MSELDIVVSKIANSLNTNQPIDHEIKVDNMIFNIYTASYEDIRQMGTNTTRKWIYPGCLCVKIFNNYFRIVLN